MAVSNAGDRSTWIAGGSAAGSWGVNVGCGIGSPEIDEASDGKPVRSAPDERLERALRTSSAKSMALDINDAVEPEL
jgi:hypothetical protein